jgi:uncharacterized lipoprotein YddW (UPF0748 family)
VSIPVDAKPPFTEDPAVPDYFDPLAFLIERAHRRGIAVHAWVPVTRVSLSHSMLSAPHRSGQLLWIFAHPFCLPDFSFPDL